jgi:Phenazine biosynthesis-like protein
LRQRQFPRAAGYAEDPATGVAAALLAVGLHLCEQSLQPGGTAMEEETTSTRYTFHQGTAMGRPSVLYVQDIQLQLDPPEEEEENVESLPEEEVMTTTALEEDETTTDAEAIMEAEIVSSSSTEEVSLPPAESKEKKPKPRTTFCGRVSFTLSGRIEVDAKEEVDF